MNSLTLMSPWKGVCCLRKRLELWLEHCRKCILQGKVCMHGEYFARYIFCSFFSSYICSVYFFFLLSCKVLWAYSPFSRFNLWSLYLCASILSNLLALFVCFNQRELYICFFISIIFKAPKSTRMHSGKSVRSPGGLIQQSQSSQWDSIITFLDSLMDRLRKNYVCSTLPFLVFLTLNFTVISENVIFHRGI